MPDKKLTDNEIVKALECRVKSKCAECPYFHSYPCDKCKKLDKDALDLINRLKEKVDEAEDTIEFADKEIKRLSVENSNLSSDLTSLQNDLTSLKAENERLIKSINSLTRSISELTDEAERQRKDKENAFEVAANIIEAEKIVVAEAKAEAYKELAELLNCYCEGVINQEWNSKVAPISWAVAYGEFKDVIDYHLKELVGETND